MTERDKHGQEINVGDHVYTKIRGGRREGEVGHLKYSTLSRVILSKCPFPKVEEIVETQQQAKDADVKNPPKVCISRILSRIRSFFHTSLIDSSVILSLLDLYFSRIDYLGSWS
jgi:hypothetical protein